MYFPDYATIATAIREASRPRFVEFTLAKGGPRTAFNVNAIEKVEEDGTRQVHIFTENTSAMIEELFPEVLAALRGAQ